MTPEPAAVVAVRNFLDQEYMPDGMFQYHRWLRELLIRCDELATYAAAQRQAVVEERDLYQRQLDKVDEALPEWKGMDCGRIEMIERLKAQLAASEAAREQATNDLRQWIENNLARDHSMMRASLSTILRTLTPGPAAQH